MSTNARFALVVLPLLSLIVFGSLFSGCGSPNSPENSETFTVLSVHPTRGFANDVAVHGNTIYVAENSYGITQYDASDVRNLQLLHQMPTARNPRLVRVAPWNNMLVAGFSNELKGYLMGDTIGVTQLFFGSSNVYDLVLFPDSSLRASAWDEQFNFTRGTRALRCDWDDGMHATYLYPDSAKLPSGERNELFYFSIDDPFEIALHGTGARGVTPIETFRKVAVAAGDLGVGIAELDEEVVQHGGRWLSDVDTPGEAWNLVYAEGYIYVADMMGGMAIIDARNLSNPNYVTSWKLTGLDHARNIVFDGHRLVLVDDFDGVFFHDISTPGNPVYKGSYRVREPNSARFMDDGTLVVASKGDGLTFFRLHY